MKHLSILCFFILPFKALQAQTFPYTFSVNHADYVDLTAAVIVTTEDPWDDLNIQVPLGFNFQLWGQNTQTLYWYGELTSNNVAGLPGVNTSPFLIAYGADLVDRNIGAEPSLSPISYKTEGVPGSRIFKMQWKDASFFAASSPSIITNLQVWLYEGSNDIELRFGPTHLNDEAVFDYSGPLIGFMDQWSFPNESFHHLYYLRGSVENPTVETITPAEDDTLVSTLDGAPGNGLVYRFSTGVVGTDNAQIAANGVRIYPSVVSDAVSIALNDETVALEKDMRYTVLDPLGRGMQAGSLNSALTEVNIADMPAGLYYVNVFSRAGLVTTGKIWKRS